MTYDHDAAARQLLDAMIEVDFAPGWLNEKTKGHLVSRMALALLAIERRYNEACAEAAKRAVAEQVAVWTPKPRVLRLVKGSTSEISHDTPQSGHSDSSGSPPSVASASDGENRPPQLGHDQDDNSLE